jgi:hypothetical protein
MRSRKYPPVMQPAAAASPPRTPLTSATVSPDAYQSLAIVENKPPAAPVPIGRKKIKKARKPRRERATCHKSLNTFASSGTKPSWQRTLGGSWTNPRTEAHSRQTPPSNDPAKILSVCRASQSPAPPPTPEPPRFPVCSQPPARPFWFAGVAYAIRLSTDMQSNVPAT